MFCYAQGMESLKRMALAADGAVLEAGAQSFPGRRRTRFGLAKGGRIGSLGEILNLDCFSGPMSQRGSTLLSASPRTKMAAPSTAVWSIASPGKSGRLDFPAAPL